MKPVLTTRALNMALRVSEGATAALGFFIGVKVVRALIRLAHMVPMSPSSEPQCGSSQNADGNPHAGSS
jgi:hypothetical protein